MEFRGQGAGGRLAVLKTAVLSYLQLIRSVVCVAAKGEVKKGKNISTSRSFIYVTAIILSVMMFHNNIAQT